MTLYNINMIIFYILIGLFALPVFLIFYLGSFSLVTLFGALFFVITFSYASHVLTSRLNLWLRILLNTLFSYIILTFEILRFISYYIQSESFNDRFFFHFTLNTVQNTWHTFPMLAFGSALALAFIGFLTIRLSITPPFRKHSVYLAGLLLLLALLCNSAIKEFIVYQWHASHLVSHKNSWSDNELSQLGINPEVLNQPLVEAQPGRNLVLIYMESLEHIYTEEKYFKALTPKLNQLKKQALYFSDMRPFPNTGWTIAGIVASQCSTPLLAQTGITGNDLMLDGFLNNAVCLGDILHAAGYEQIFMGGAPHKFAGKGQFFLDHQYDEINGVDELKGSITEPSYLSPWGLFDDSLFALSYKKFEQLAAANKPFNLTLLTVDTHAPAGHTSKSCKAYPYIKNKALDAVYCTDQLIGQFIHRLAQHPAYKNTTIVLFSDHLSMRNAAEKYYPEKSKRKLQYLIINSPLTGEVTTSGTTMDVAASLLEAIGVKHNAEFLPAGKLLNERDKTLEADAIPAIKYINSQVLSRSQYELCSDDQFTIKTLDKNNIQIGDKKIPISYQGHYLSNSDFQAQFSVIIFFDKNLAIRNYFLKTHTEIPLLIRKNKGLKYLLLEKNNANEIALYLGSQWQLSALASFPALNKVDFSIEHCFEKMVINDRQSQNLFSLNTHSVASCAINGQNKYVRYDQQNNVLDLLRVNVADNYYHVQLQINDQGSQLWLKSSESVDNDEGDECQIFSPLFYEQSLSIPNLMINGQKYQLELHQQSSLTKEYLFNIPENMHSLFSRKN